MAPTRWGIVGVGKIAEDFSKCFDALNPESHKIVAVASRSMERAEKFANSYSIPNVYGSYAELSRDPDVEVVYVATDHSMHFEYAKMMLEGGKHVLCEKPMCTNANDARKLVEIAKENGKFLMEGVWSRFFPAYDHVRALLNNDVLGRPIQVHAVFGLQHFIEDRVLRADKERNMTLDIGVYAIQICNLVFSNMKPKILAASGTLDDKGCEDNVVMLLDYGQGRLANLTLSSRCFMENCAIIACEKSYIKLFPPFHSPTLVEVNGNAIGFSLPDTKETFNYENSIGLSYEIEHVRKCLQDGLLESPNMTLQESVDIADIVEDVRKRIGMTMCGDPSRVGRAFPLIRVLDDRVRNKLRLILCYE